MLAEALVLSDLNLYLVLCGAGCLGQLVKSIEASLFGCFDSCAFR